MPIGDWAAWAGVVVAVAVAVAGLVQGTRAQRTAAQAVEQARRANELAEQVQRQQREDSDVRWNSGFAFGTTLWQVTNVGEDEAFDVQLTLTVKLDEPRRAHAERVPHGSSVDLDLVDAVAFEFGYAGGDLPDGLTPTLPLEELVRWRTATGMPRRHSAAHDVPLRRALFPPLPALPHLRERDDPDA